MLERVGFEDKRYALLSRDDEHDIRVELESRETKEHRDNEGLLSCQHASRTPHEMDIRLFVVKWIRLNKRQTVANEWPRYCAHLNFRPEDDMCIAGVREAEYATKLVHRELANVPDLELWWLRNAHTTRPRVSWRRGKG